MATAKFYKRKDVIKYFFLFSKKITALESSVGSALLDFEHSNKDLQPVLKLLLLSSVKDFTSQVGSKKPTYLVFIPYPCLKVFQKVSKKIIPELERKLKAIVFFAAKRSIQSKWIKQHRSQMRPRNRTLTQVYDNLLEDLCSPGTVIGRRTRVRVDGSRFYRVFLDQVDQKEMEHRIEATTGIYKALTTRDVQFEFRADHVFYQLKQKKKQEVKQQQ